MTRYSPFSPMLLCDFYKISHRNMYPKGTTHVYSTWTPRASRLKGVDKVVTFGLQMFIKKYLIEFFNEQFFHVPLYQIVDDYKRIIAATLGQANPETAHIEQLHDLEYLPLSICALPEGTPVPLRVPMFTIENTHPDFFWLTNYIETLMSCELWQASTSATIARAYRSILDKYSKETVGASMHVDFQAHDFSMRGMSSLDSAISSGMGHLLYFEGTDTIPAIQAVEHYYGADIGKAMVGCSIPASEHSIQCTYGDDRVYFQSMLELFPTGPFSIVADGYDFWNVMCNVLPEFKSQIMARDGKVIIRPDSGCPIKIICGDPEGATEAERKGAVEVLWDLFGGDKSFVGYQRLDRHIGLVYGDSITLERAETILSRLKDKGFASCNITLGVGSFSYQYNTRDTFGFALKSTHCVIDDVEHIIYKAPKTDDGTKTSQRGRVAVIESFDDPNYLICMDCLRIGNEKWDNKLKEVYRDGKLLVDQTFEDIRRRARR